MTGRGWLAAAGRGRTVRPRRTWPRSPARSPWPRPATRTADSGQRPDTGRTADRAVSAVVAAMVAAVAAATAAGMWLSYGGLHTFATRAGLAGAEAWAWPASVDLFIVAGEAGVTVSALRRVRDRPAWAYLALGVAVSVAGNVEHVNPARLPWEPYAVAAVPPLAAGLALAALLRHAYRLATDQTADTRRTADSGQRPATRTRKRTAGQRTARSAPAGRPAAAGRAAVLAARDRHPDMTTADLAALAGVSDRTARRALSGMAASNGHRGTS